jgi:hypothetical protein
MKFKKEIPMTFRIVGEVKQYASIIEKMENPRTEIVDKTVTLGLVREMLEGIKWINEEVGEGEGKDLWVTNKCRVGDNREADASWFTCTDGLGHQTARIMILRDTTLAQEYTLVTYTNLSRGEKCKNMWAVGSSGDEFPED